MDLADLEPGAYLVFSQQPTFELDVQACAAQARRFFAATLAAAPGGVAVGAHGDSLEPRVITARARQPPDLELADEAEAGAGGGLALLARRCPVVWRIDAREAPDPVALLLAAILASLLLGPILDPAGPELFGVKTARDKLARLAQIRRSVNR